MEWDLRECEITKVVEPCEGEGAENLMEKFGGSPLKAAPIPIFVRG